MTPRERVKKCWGRTPLRPVSGHKTGFVTRVFYAENPASHRFSHSGTSAGIWVCDGPRCNSFDIFGFINRICPFYGCVGRTATTRRSRRVGGGGGGGGGGCIADGNADATPVAGVGGGGGGAAARAAGSSTAGGGGGGRPALDHLNTGTPKECASKQTSKQDAREPTLDV